MSLGFVIDAEIINILTKISFINDISSSMFRIIKIDWVKG